MDIPLKSLKFLSIDCQATGNSPKNNHLLEIGWLSFSADAFENNTSLSPQTSIILPPADFKLPKQITRLTGINASHFEDAVSDLSVIASLNDVALSIACENRPWPCLAVIHFARYEISHLKRLFRKYGNTSALPFEVICTHQVASRTLAHLPRKGLRAVAGYLGHSVPSLRRCGVHLIATAFIWCKMIKMLADVEDVHTLEQFNRWLKRKNIQTVSKTYPMAPEARSGLPNGPGVYRMKRSNGDTLYIGKATSLKLRVNSYFHNSRKHSEKKLEMLSQATQLDHTSTPTALEAALLESDEIKIINPPYNIALSPENRRLCFVSRNFGFQSPIRTKRCRLGPVPHANSFAAAHRIAQITMDPDRPFDRSDISATLDMPENYCPEPDGFHSGVLLFFEKYGAVMRRLPIGRAILHVGRRSCVERAREKAERLQRELEAEDASEMPSEFVWTPEAVSKALETVCRRCGFLLRRARWMTILSESTVAWRISRSTPHELNIIQLSSGMISKRCQSHISHRMPQPPNHDEIISNRQSNIDLMTYDRLRVLTTEMRRLISEDRLVCIGLGKERYLLPKNLQILFSWI